MPDSLWRAYDEQYLLTDRKVHVFKLMIDDYTKNVSNPILSIEEISKSNRFRKQADKDKFVLRRTILRILLGRFLNMAPEDIEFSIAYNKKPITHGIHFNTSNSKDYILIGISTNPIGVDIEYVDRRFNISDILNQCFDTEECEFIMHSNDMMMNFYRQWTRKEALLKATGEGLVDDLTQISVAQDLVKRNKEYYQIQSISHEEYMMSLSCSFKDDLVFNFWNKANL